MESGHPERRFPTLFPVTGSLGWLAHEDTGGNRLEPGRCQHAQGSFRVKQIEWFTAATSPDDHL